MAEVAPADAVAAPVAAPVKPAKKKGPAKTKRQGPNTADLVLKAVSESKERKGISYQALRRNLAAQGCDNPALVKRVVKNLVANKKLVQTKGAGASGSFKAAKTAQKPGKVSKETDKAKKPAAKKPAAKKVPAAKKPKAGKTTPKVKKAAVKKVSAMKVSTTTTKGPKKGSKKTIAKTTAASPKKAAKKPAAKKVAKK